MDVILSQVPAGVQIAALIMAIFGVVNVFVSDDVIPGWLKPIWNALSSSYGKGANHPNKQ